MKNNLFTYLYLFFVFILFSLILVVFAYTRIQNYFCFSCKISKIYNNYKYATHTFLCFKYQMIAFLKVFKFKISIHSWRLLFEMTDSPDTPIANVNVREKIQIFNNFLKILKFIVETWFFYWIVKKIMHFFMQKTELIYLKTANFTVVFRNFLKTANFFKKI